MFHEKVFPFTKVPAECRLRSCNHPLRDDLRQVCWSLSHVLEIAVGPPGHTRDCQARADGDPARPGRHRVIIIPGKVPGTARQLTGNKATADQHLRSVERLKGRQAAYHYSAESVTGPRIPSEASSGARVSREVSRADTPKVFVQDESRHLPKNHREILTGLVQGPDHTQSAWQGHEFTGQPAHRRIADGRPEPQQTGVSLGADTKQTEKMNPRLHPVEICQ